MKLHNMIYLKPLLLLALCGLLCGCGQEDQASMTADASLPGSVASSADTSVLEGTPIPETTEPEETIPEPEPEPFQEYDIKVMMVGDNLMHMGIVNTGRNSDGTYSYDMLFTGIADFLEAADVKIINQETIFGGNQLGFSGFPHFNSPTEVGDAIAAAGFNVVLHASNHAADQGIKGLIHCVEFWEKYPEITMIGITKEEYTEDTRIGYVKVGDYTFSILNYTYSPNSEIIPSSIIGHLNILCNFNEKNGKISLTELNPMVLEDIKTARETSDVVIVCPHWGNEYQTKPSKYQEAWAKEMVAAGADVIIGTHPHVVQPVAWIEAENGNRGLCFYSLGNYLSTQRDAICVLEGLAWIDFHVTEDGITLSEENSGVIPLINQYKSGPVRYESAYLLEEYTEEQASRHGIRSYGGVSIHVEDLLKWSDEIFGDMVISKATALGTANSEEPAE